MVLRRLVLRTSVVEVALVRLPEELLEIRLVGNLNSPDKRRVLPVVQPLIIVIQWDLVNNQARVG